MAPPGVVDPPRWLVKHTIPDREKQTVLLVHLESVIECAQDLARQAEIRLWQRLRSESIHGRDRKQGRADAVAADIQQVKGEMVVIEPVIAERVTPQLGRGNESPVGDDFTLS